ncbi:putative maspardin isoform X2, partial [Penaeus vannamei]
CLLDDLSDLCDKVFFQDYHTVSMDFESDLSQSTEYKSFRSTVPLKQVVVDNDGLKVWKLYDAGPRGVRCPLICLPPVSGTADCFYKQILPLTARGYRIISIFNYTDSAPVFWMLPATLLKKMIIGRFPRKLMDSQIADSIDFMVERLESLNQSELASRLTLNCSPAYIQPQKVQVEVTILDVFDESALSQTVKEEVYKCYPSARLAHLKTGGNFPFLARADEVNIYIQVHLRAYEGTDKSATDSGTPVER